jgi:PIN domain nuclease of toxin-antitoxin system
MPDKFVLDACAVIAYLNDEEGSDKLEADYARLHS